MAKKVCFFTDVDCVYKERSIEFTYIKGLAYSQKQKNVDSFHSSINKQYPNSKILEVSTKSRNDLGVQLSAFNLKLDGKPIESIFQSSKVFLGDKQYEFLINYSPKDAKKYISSLECQTLTKFRYKNIEYPLWPKTFFYDYIYNIALFQNSNISNNIKEYNIFTDIEFNDKKQVNCQARACAIYAYLLNTNNVEKYLSNVERFKELYGNYNEQFSLFDL